MYCLVLVCILHFMSVGGPGQLRGSNILLRSWGQETWQISGRTPPAPRSRQAPPSRTLALTWCLQPASAGYCPSHGSWGPHLGCALCTLAWSLSLEKPLNGGHCTPKSWPHFLEARQSPRVPPTRSTVCLKPALEQHGLAVRVQGLEPQLVLIWLSMGCVTLDTLPNLSKASVYSSLNRKRRGVPTTCRLCENSWGQSDQAVSSRLDQSLLFHDGGVGEAVPWLLPQGVLILEAVFFTAFPRWVGCLLNRFWKTRVHLLLLVCGVMLSFCSPAPLWCRHLGHRAFMDSGARTPGVNPLPPAPRPAMHYSVPRGGYSSPVPRFLHL